MCSICKPYVEYKVFMCKCVYMQKQPPEMFFKKSVLRNFAKLTAKKPVPESLYLIKLQAWPATLLKKRLWHRCFPVNFAKISKNTFFTEHLWLTASDFVHLKGATKL